MMKTGLTSVTFRALGWQQIIGLAAESGLDGIEWGTDVHMKDAGAAREIAEATRNAGLEVLSVGSYWYAGADSDGAGQEALSICGAAGAKTLRVWAGKAGSLEAEGEARERTVRALKTLCEAAPEITVATEYHAGTLTDCAPSALRLLHEVGCANFRTYWQPSVFLTAEENARALASVLPRAANIHVFSWRYENKDYLRLPLEGGAENWKRYLDVLHGSSENRALILEFVRGDDPQAFLEDARTLKSWLCR